MPVSFVGSEPRSKGGGVSGLGGAGGEARCAGVKGSGTTVETGHPSTRTLKKSAEIFEPAVQGRVWAHSRQPDLYV